MVLVQGLDGNLYGTTQAGGAAGQGTVFKIVPSGGLTSLYSFSTRNGVVPLAGLAASMSGNFYGTTYQGGRSGAGTVFQVTPAGVATTLHSFCAFCGEGNLPAAQLVQGGDGNYYGTTIEGGAYCVPQSSYGCGTIFKITSGGTLTTLYSFCSQNTNCPDGYNPYGGLTQASDGNFYGTTTNGGPTVPDFDGTVFKMSPSGALTTLHSFTFKDGAAPYGTLVQASDGSFYGTTSGGGPARVGPGQGTIFKITASGTFTQMYNFCTQAKCPDGSVPFAGLIQATDGNFYGVTNSGGGSSACPNGCGTIFRMSVGGVLTTLYSFSKSDGAFPTGALMQATDGDLYGTTTMGGASNAGTVYSLALGLAPFVKTLPTSGKEGASITILGDNLTGATSVSFNGAAAAFTVVSATEITTTVPNGAITGTIQIITPSGTLTSNVPFRVRP